MSVLFDGDKAIEIAKVAQQSVGDGYRIILMVVPIDNIVHAHEIQVSTPIDENEILAIFRIMANGIQPSP